MPWGVSPSFLLVQAPRVKIFSHLNSKNSVPLRQDVCRMFVSWRMSHSKSVLKRWYRNAGWAVMAGAPQVLWEIPVWGSLFSFSSAFVKSTLWVGGGSWNFRKALKVLFVLENITVNLLVPVWGEEKIFVKKGNKVRVYFCLPRLEFQKIC